MNLHIVAEYGINFVLFDKEKPSAFLFQITNKVYNEKHATKTYFISVHLHKYDHKKLLYVRNWDRMDIRFVRDRGGGRIEAIYFTEVT